MLILIYCYYYSYDAIINSQQKDNDVIEKYGIPAVLNFQFHLIGRLDE